MWRILFGICSTLALVCALVSALTYRRFTNGSKVLVGFALLLLFIGIASGALVVSQKGGTTEAWSRFFDVSFCGLGLMSAGAGMRLYWFALGIRQKEWQNFLRWRSTLAGLTSALSLTISMLFRFHSLLPGGFLNFGLMVLLLLGLVGFYLNQSLLIDLWKWWANIRRDKEARFGQGQTPGVRS